MRKAMSFRSSNTPAINEAEPARASLRLVPQALQPAKRLDRIVPSMLCWRRAEALRAAGALAVADRPSFSLECTQICMYA